MATAGSSTHATIDVGGRSSVEVGRVVDEAVSAQGTYTLASAGHDTYQLVRSFRPTWAIALGVVGIPFLGLGVLVFLVRKTEVCTLKVVDGPTGAVLTVSGALLPTTLAALRQELHSSSRTDPPAVRSALRVTAPAEIPAPEGAPAVGPVVASPDGSASEPDFEHTVHRASSRSAQGGRAYWLRLPEGRMVALTGTTLLGRDPTPLPGDVASTLVPLADPSMRVSKTHLALRVMGGALQAQDLHSTNGTVISEPSGGRVALSGGESAPVRPGAFLELGGVRIEVGVGG